MRFTEPGPLGAGVECGTEYCSHRYSSSQAWNADQSLLVVANGCNGLCFFDGRTYAPKFARAQWRECEWHSVNPAVMICVGDREIRIWDPVRDTFTVAFSSASYSDLRFGPGKGNPSRDGNLIAVRAVPSAGGLVVFAYDFAAKKKYPDINLAGLPGANDSCSISPLGTRIVCFQTMPDDTEHTFIFDINDSLLQHWQDHHRPGHGGMALDADGSEIYVGISKSTADAYHVIKRRLSDGRATTLTRYGEGSHVSMRAFGLPGWAIVSYAGDPADVRTHPTWEPFAQDVVAVALDGSGKSRLIARTRNVDAGYWSEIHASPSPDGSRIVWSSNWGNPTGPVYEFVTRVNWSTYTNSTY